MSLIPTSYIHSKFTAVISLISVSHTCCHCKAHCWHVTYSSTVYPLPSQSSLSCHLFQHRIPIAVPKLIVMSLIPAPYTHCCPKAHCHVTYSSTVYPLPSQSSLSCHLFQHRIPIAVPKLIVMSLIPAPYTHCRPKAHCHVTYSSTVYPLPSQSSLSCHLFQHRIPIAVPKLIVMSPIPAPYTHCCPKAHCHVTYSSTVYPLLSQSSLSCHLFQHRIPIAVPKLIVMSLIPAPGAT